MHLPRYHYKTNDTFLDYEFNIIGPKGNIKKVIRFTQIGPDIYNLGFDDLDVETGEISDTSVTNNSNIGKAIAIPYTLSTGHQFDETQ